MYMPGRCRTCSSALQNRDVGGGIASVTRGFVVLRLCRQRHLHRPAHGSARRSRGRGLTRGNNLSRLYHRNRVRCPASRQLFRLALQAVSEAPDGPRSAPHGPALEPRLRWLVGDLLGPGTRPARPRTGATRDHQHPPLQRCGGGLRGQARHRPPTANRPAQAADREPAGECPLPRSPSTTSPMGVSCMVRSSRRPRHPCSRASSTLRPRTVAAPADTSQIAWALAGHGPRRPPRPATCPRPARPLGQLASPLRVQRGERVVEEQDGPLPHLRLDGVRQGQAEGTAPPPRPRRVRRSPGPPGPAPRAPGRPGAGPPGWSAESARHPAAPPAASGTPPPGPRPTPRAGTTHSQPGARQSGRTPPARPGQPGHGIGARRR